MHKIIIRQAQLTLQLTSAHQILAHMGKRKETTIEKEAETSAYTWNKVDSLIFGDGGAKASTKIASFDMDDTLIRVKSGAKFAKDASDWLFWHDSVPKKLKELEDAGYKIVIFTNQNGITLGKTKAEHIQKKIQDLGVAAGVKFQAFIASADDEYRKPATKMWAHLESLNGGIKIDMTASFFCGDAAGRKDGKHKDFSDSDLKFALNVGVPFKTPEVCFLGEVEKQIEVKGFSGKNVPQKGSIFEGEDATTVTPVDKEMIIFCGAPGAGKSTFWQNYLPTYVRVNRDSLKTKEKCYKVADEEMAKGKSVVIDNTNPTKADRAYFMELAKKHKYTARCFFFLTPKDHCFHNDYMRVVHDKRVHLSGKAGSIPIHGWFKNHEPPTAAEGFKEVKKVNFIAKFVSEEDKQAYQTFSKK